MAGRGLRQFGLLMWKNFLLQRRAPWVTLFELVLPVLFASLLIAFRTLVDYNFVHNNTTYPSFEVNQLPIQLTPPFGTGHWQFAYVPNISVVEDLLDQVSSNLNKNLQRGRGFANVADLEEYTRIQSRRSSAVLGAAVFNNEFPDDDTLPLTVDYSIRLAATPRNKAHFYDRDDNPLANTSQWFTDLLFPIVAFPGPRLRNDTKGGAPGYDREGFLAIQQAFDKAIIQHRGESVDDMELVMNRYPYPPYVDDAYVIVIQSQLPGLLMLSLVFAALNIVKDIVYEKEKKLKESMKMMGLANWLHWLAWFIRYFILLVISLTVCTILFTVDVGSHGAVINNTDPSVLFVFLLIYAIATVTFCFAVSVFFSIANTAAVAGGVLFFLTYVPYLFIQPRYQDMSLGEKLGACLLSNTGMCMGAQLIGMFEGTGEGVQWSNIHRGVSVDDDFTFLHVLAMLLFDTLLYSIIAWYMEAVFPGEYGVPQPWYFPVTRTYWCGPKPCLLVEEDEEQIPLVQDRRESDVSDFLEPDPTSIPAGIRIKKLKKVFDKNKAAVDGIDLSMYEGQITALLGHNGAGKTTTLSMLTGLFPATGGTAYVNGYNIATEMSAVRSSLGLCPQHDILFDRLTVEEHLYFFAKLKGLQSNKVQDEIDKYITALGLEDKRDVQSRALSGGMKRKLSVCIALIADSKVVMLDEPTSGMDPSARRFTWDLLQQHREGRTILLTTHFMDEADLLGDRIAIMSHGQIRCCGSSLFLKKKYGVGYHMTIVKHPLCDVGRITYIVHHHVPDAQMESNIGAELAYILPHESSANFEALFTELESQKEDLGIASYGASVTTMEEVFLRVGEESDASLKGILQPNGPNHKGYRSMSKSDLSDSNSANSTAKAGVANSDGYVPMEDGASGSLYFHHSTGVILYIQQFYAMFIKRVLHTRRNFLIMIAQLLIPLLFTVIAVIVAKTYPGPQTEPKLDLSLQPYGKSIAQYSSGKNPTNLTKLLAKNFDYQFTGTSTATTNLSGHDYQNITNYLLKEATYNLVGFNQKNMVSALFELKDLKTRATSFFNNQPFHAIASSVNAIDNAILKTKLNHSYSIQTSNYPLPLTIEEETNDHISSTTTGFSIAFCLVFGMSFLASSFVVFLIKESSNKAKHIQFVSGVDLVNFWLSTLGWDLLNYLLPVLVICILFAAADITAYAEDGRLGYILLLLFLYGWAVIPLMYLFSFLFTVPSTGFVRMTIFNIVSGLVFFMAVQILLFPTLKLEYVAHGLTWPFLLSPSFCLGQALADFYTNYEIITLCKSFTPFSEAICAQENITYDESYIGWNQDGGIGRYLTFLFWGGVIYMALVLIVESKIFRKLWYAIKPKRPPRELIQFGVGVEEDEDVAAERERIEGTMIGDLMATDTLIIKNLNKVYSTSGSRGLVAVDDMSFGVALGECFGLLGNNGAGKTSTFQMLTGDAAITSGTAYVDGYDIKQNLKIVQQKLGYCPQFDALIDQMTGRETLWMYARLRGVPESYIGESVNNLISLVLLDEHADKLVKTFSGGNKRKLSTAIALVGDPPIVLLDEPTTGMDPVARRLLWDAISQVVADGSRCVILTSHSMEECEALCTRLAIMVNGRFKCTGSTQHLKTRFGQGYTLLARVSYTIVDPDLRPLKHFIEETFPGSKLKDEHQGMVHYHITDTSLTWARIFGTMEQAKNQFHIEDYSVSQTTLEQVFINFARAQRDTGE
ncbi:phospholipid-transporting ATPase ABCA3-like isoform X2 [Glandiceps talaboti]